MHPSESILGCPVDHRPGLAQKLFSRPKRQSTQSYAVPLNCKHVGLRTTYGCKGQVTKSLQIDYSSGWNEQLAPRWHGCTCDLAFCRGNWRDDNDMSSSRNGRRCFDQVQAGFARKYPMPASVRRSCGWPGSASSFSRRRLI